MSSEPEQKDLKIIEKIENFSKIFDSIESFTNYYHLHKKAMDEMTTQKLNKLYQISEGDKHYKITKLKKEITLKRIDQEPKRDPYKEQLDSLNDRILKLENRVKLITTTVNKLTDIINDHFSKPQ